MFIKFLWTRHALGSWTSGGICCAHFSSAFMVKKFIDTADYKKIDFIVEYFGAFESLFEKGTYIHPVEGPRGSCLMKKLAFKKSRHRVSGYQNSCLCRISINGEGGPRKKNPKLFFKISTLLPTDYYFLFTLHFTIRTILLVPYTTGLVQSVYTIISISLQVLYIVYGGNSTNRKNLFFRSVISVASLFLKISYSNTKN
jgi:hypothetical protein